MEDIDQHDSIEAAVCVRKRFTVELLHGQPQTVSNQHIDAFDPEVCASIKQRSRQFPIATTNVQKAAVGWDDLSEQFRKTADSPWVNVDRMEVSEQSHLRPTPRILKKKLEKIISTPNVRQTTTAATRRTKTTGFVGPNPAP